MKQNLYFTILYFIKINKEPLSIFFNNYYLPAICYACVLCILDESTRKYYHYWTPTETCWRPMVTGMHHGRSTCLLKKRPPIRHIGLTYGSPVGLRWSSIIFLFSCTHIGWCIVFSLISGWEKRTACGLMFLQGKFTYLEKWKKLDWFFQNLSWLITVVTNSRIKPLYNPEDVQWYNLLF